MNVLPTIFEVWLLNSGSYFFLYKNRLQWFRWSLVWKCLLHTLNLEDQGMTSNIWILSIKHIHVYPLSILKTYRHPTGPSHVETPTKNLDFVILLCRWTIDICSYISMGWNLTENVNNNTWLVLPNHKLRFLVLQDGFRFAENLTRSQNSKH